MLRSAEKSNYTDELRRIQMETYKNNEEENKYTIKYK